MPITVSEKQRTELCLCQPAFTSHLTPATLQYLSVCSLRFIGVFLIPYFIMLFITGVPLFLMELSLGQYGAAGPITVWKCCPLLKGIGIGMLCVSTLVCLYYNVIIAWTFYYLGSSFQSPLPWSCEAVANAGLCGNETAVNGSTAKRLSPTEIFWK